MDTVVRVYVVTGYGLNCEEETAAAWAGAGATVEVVHAEDLFSGARPLAAADIVHLSGGFSYGDNLGSGKVFAVRMRHDERGGQGTLAAELQAWVAGGGQLVGVCNGFQILVKSGLLPNLRGDLRLEATLAPNSPGGFVDRWIRCRPAPAGGAAALTDPSGRVLGLMPHPEAFLDAALHPDRQRAPGSTAAPFFSNLVNAARALRGRR
jgi:phosphoribosylformylglycinamidine (FGAM) synthase-like amidotransferase family enzyme